MIGIGEGQRSRLELEHRAMEIDGDSLLLLLRAAACHAVGWRPKSTLDDLIDETGALTADLKMRGVAPDPLPMIALSLWEAIAFRGLTNPVAGGRHTPWAQGHRERRREDSQPSG